MSDGVAQPRAEQRTLGGSACALLTRLDVLLYAPEDLQKQFRSTKGPCGGAATALIPVVIAAIFAGIYTTNDAIHDVSQSSVVDLTHSAPMLLQITCISRDSLGNVNPFCPGVSYARNPSPAGFQLVPSISDSFCQAAIPRVRNRTASQLWLDPQATGPETESSPSIWSIEELLGVPVPEIGGDGDPFQAIRFADLARDLSIVPESLWAGAGTHIPTVGAGRTLFDASTGITALQNVSSMSRDDYAKARNPRFQRTDLVNELELVNIGVAGLDPLVDAAANAASAPLQTITLDAPIPLCPFPNMELSGSLSVSPPASGLGVIMTLPPYFNWSAFLTSGDVVAATLANTLVQFSLAHSNAYPSNLLPTSGLSLRTVKGPSSLGGSPFSDLLQTWQWYARTMSWSDSPALTMPFISYDISVTRNVYTNGSVTFDATATATLGELSHGDASNYYGWGDLNAEPTPHLAACGDLYAVSSADLFELFAIAKILGFDGTWAKFIADGSWALADMLPGAAVNFTLGCGNEQSAIEGWPRPACMAAQALRTGWLGGADEPLIFNVDASANASGIRARLWSVYDRIQNQSDAFIHKSLLPRPIANYAPGNDDLLETKNGWQAARAQANSISAMMQAQHGCGLYCSEPLAYGVGVTSIVWTTPTSTQNEPSPEAAAEAAVRSAVIYVQRARPAVVCDNASFPLPWKRNDDSEFFSGDNSLLHMSTGFRGWRTARLSAPVAAVLFRSSSWTDIRWSNSKQSILALVGSSLGYAGILFTTFRLVKRYFHHHAGKHAIAAANTVDAIIQRTPSRVSASRPRSLSQRMAASMDAGKGPAVEDASCKPSPSVEDGVLGAAVADALASDPVASSVRDAVGVVSDGAAPAEVTVSGAAAPPSAAGEQPARVSVYVCE